MTTSLNWPQDKLSLPTIGGYGIDPQEGVARTDMDSGPARQRRRWTTSPTQFAVTFKFTRTQLVIFEGWYYNVAAEGANWFNIPLLSGLGIVTHECRFMGQYKATPWNQNDDGNAEWWSVTTTLEVRNRPTLDAGATLIVLDSDPSALIATIAAFAAFIDTGVTT